MIEYVLYNFQYMSLNQCYCETNADIQDCNIQFKNKK